MSGKLSQEEVSKTVEFCLNAFEQHAPEKTEAVVKKMEMATLATNAAAPSALTTSDTEAKIEKKAAVDPEGLSPDEMRILNTIRARQMLRREDTLSINNFSNDAIHGFVPVVQRGSLTLQKAGAKAGAKTSPAADVPAVVSAPKTSAVESMPLLSSPQTKSEAGRGRALMSGFYRVFQTCRSMVY